MLYNTRVAIQEPTEVRDASGGVSYTYETVTGKESIPARIVPETDEARGERMTVIEERYTVVLGGQHMDLTTDQVIYPLGEVAYYDIKRVVPAGRMSRPVTVVMAERVGI